MRFGLTIMNLNPNFSSCSGTPSFFFPKSVEAKKSVICRKGDAVCFFFFGDAKGILLKDYLPPGYIVNGQYNVDLLIKLTKAVTRKH